MAALKLVGSAEAGAASSGSAKSYLLASGVTRSRQAHRITACCLSCTQRKAAYSSYSGDTSLKSTRCSCFRRVACSCTKRRLESLQFLFWDLDLALELTILTLIRSFREADYCLHHEALVELLPYFFANNNVNYVWWLSINLRDMMTVDQKHPEVARKFFKGHFVVQKSSKEFSSIAIDLPTNKTITNDDGVPIGLTEHPTKFRRWMIAGPEVSRLLAHPAKRLGELKLLNQQQASRTREKCSNSN